MLSSAASRNSDCRWGSRNRAGSGSCLEVAEGVVVPHHRTLRVHPDHRRHLRRRRQGSSRTLTRFAPSSPA